MRPRFIIFIISLCNFFPNMGTMQAFVIRILIDTLQGYLEVDVYIVKILSFGNWSNGTTEATSENRIHNTSNSFFFIPSSHHISTYYYNPLKGDCYFINDFSIQLQVDHLILCGISNNAIMKTHSVKH
jgi:hypothetical protein